MSSKRKFELVSKYVGTEVESGFIKPRRATAKSAAYDIYNNTGKKIVIPAGGTSDAITTFVKIKMEDDNVVLFFSRSNHGFKNDARLSNCVGVIDADYYNNPKNEGECFVKIRNPSTTKELVIDVGEGMAQAMFTYRLLTDDDADTVGGDREGGIGSTTTK